MGLKALSHLPAKRRPFELHSVAWRNSEIIVFLHRRSSWWCPTCPLECRCPTAWRLLLHATRFLSKPFPASAQRSHLQSKAHKALWADACENQTSGEVFDWTHTDRRAWIYLRTSAWCIRPKAFRGPRSKKTWVMQSGGYETANVLFSWENGPLLPSEGVCLNDSCWRAANDVWAQPVTHPLPFRD